MSPVEIVQAELDAYNRKDVAAIRCTFALDAEQYELHGVMLAKGHAAMRTRYLARFAEPSLHARLLSRNLLGSFVIDHEEVTRDIPAGRGTVEVLCVDEGREGLIVKASYAPSAPRLGR